MVHILDMYAVYFNTFVTITKSMMLLVTRMCDRLTVTLYSHLSPPTGNGLDTEDHARVRLMLTT